MIGVLLTVACIAGLTGCGSDGTPKASLGSPENPVPAERTLGTDGQEGAAASAAPTFKDLVDRERAAPARHSRTNPCALVTKAQAQTILGARLLDPHVAPQGPTCVYRNRTGQSFVTVAVTPLDIDRVRRQAHRLRAVEVADRKAYCGVYGAPVLYLPLSRGRVLSVSAQCATAMRFASRAVPRLAS